MSSRSFPSSALANVVAVGNPHDSEKPKVKEREDSIEPGSPVLIPGLDLLNHRPFAKITWQWGTVNSRMVSNEALASSSEICNNYGPKSNEERVWFSRLSKTCLLNPLVIMGYGFSLADNPMDHCVLPTAQKSRFQRLGIETLAPGDQQLAQAADLGNYHKESGKGIHWVRLYNQAIDEGGRRAPYVFSPQYLHDTARALANERESKANNLCLLDQSDLVNEVLSHNRFKVMCAITMLLQKKHSDIVQYNFNLPQWPANEKQFHAARYRQGQLHILRSVHTSLLDRLAGLAGLQDPESRDARVIRLEHTLTETPKCLLTDYRAVLNAGLGTRNPEKIKERGFTEYAFTIWLCGLWLWRTPKNKDLDKNPGSGHHNGLLQSLSFLDDVYLKPPYTDSSATMHRSTERSSASTCDAYIEPLVASLLDTVQAAVQKHPDSLYNSPACTQERLLWCLNIVREESVMSPNLEGKSGEVNDELLLFLDYPMLPDCQ